MPNPERPSTNAANPERANRSTDSRRRLGNTAYYASLESAGSPNTAEELARLEKQLQAELAKREAVAKRLAELRKQKAQFAETKIEEVKPVKSKTTKSDSVKTEATKSTSAETKSRLAEKTTRPESSIPNSAPKSKTSTPNPLVANKPKSQSGNLPSGWADLPKMTSEPVRTDPEKVKSTANKAKNNSAFRRAFAYAMASVLSLTAIGATAGFIGTLHKNHKQESEPKFPERPAKSAPVTPANIPEKFADNESITNDAEDIHLSNGDVATWSFQDQTVGQMGQPVFTDDYQPQAPFIGNVSPIDSEHFAGGLTTFRNHEAALEYMSRNPEFRQGLIDGYNKEGMWTSANKPSEIAFASAREVSALFNNDEVDMMQYAAANQTETFSDYLACMPDAIKPKAFRGLTLQQMNEKLESMSEREYKEIQTWFNNAMDMAFTRRAVLNGRYNNAYMALKNPNGEIDHANMQLVSCTSDEYGTEVTEFFWTDESGKEVGSMLVKLIPVRDAEGNITAYDGCMQAVTPAGSHIYDGLPSIDPTPTPTPTPTPPPTPTPTNPVIHIVEPTPTPTPRLDIPKNPENLVRIDEQILDDIAEDIGTEEVTITPTESVSPEDLTEKPTESDYEGTEATIIQNEASTEAEPVIPQNFINDYSEDLGGANENEYAPVQADETAQAAADAAEIPVAEAPTGGAELDDVLAGLGIGSEVDQIVNEVRSNPTEYVATEGMNLDDILAEYGIQ